ncbi:MAG TPA: MotA/TolQ/ExbB proton channel family protein [Candidatus Acidoferrales bacterium]|nr:MotA/TolQ/ExbB proton channel family protein [Candidatus Acidoferrales bacterium]
MEITLSVVLALGSGLVALAVVYLSVDQVFFLPQLVKLAKGLTTAGSWEPVWIAVAALSGAALSFFGAATSFSAPLPAEPKASWDPLLLWNSMGWLARAVVVGLFIMSGWEIGVMIDRWMAYNAARKQSRAFAPAVAGALREGRIDEAIRVAERHKKSHSARVVVAGLTEFKAQQYGAGNESIEASKRALKRAEAVVHAELKQGVRALEMIGKAAPLVGFLGATAGLISALRQLSEHKTSALSASTPGVAVALFTTAVGLLLGLVSAVTLNHLTGRIDGFTKEMKNNSAELLVYFSERMGTRRRGLI